MDGRQRIPILQRFGRCRKLRSGKAIIKKLALQEAWEKYDNADIESDTSAVLPESLFQPSEDVKPPILKPPSPISRRRLYEVTSSSCALQSTSQDTTPSTVRVIRKQPEFSVQPHPIATKFRILRNPPARIRSAAPPFSQQFPSIFDGMSTMEKVVRVERELELEELVRNEDYGQSSMEVTREVAIREYYETLTPYKQFLFKDRMDRMGEQLPSAVIRSRPNVRPADFLRSTSPLFMPTSLMENPLAGIALQEIQDEERIIECKQRTGKIFVTVGLFPDDLDFDKKIKWKKGCMAIKSCSSFERLLPHLNASDFGCSEAPNTTDSSQVKRGPILQAALVHPAERFIVIPDNFSSTEERDRFLIRRDKMRMLVLAADLLVSHRDECLQSEIDTGEYEEYWYFGDSYSNAYFSMLSRRQNAIEERRNTEGIQPNFAPILTDSCDELGEPPGNQKSLMYSDSKRERPIEGPAEEVSPSPSPVCTDLIVDDDDSDEQDEELEVDVVTD